MSGRDFTFCKMQIRIKLNYPKEMLHFLTTGNLLAFPFIRALNCEIWDGSEVCVSSAWIMAVGDDG